jgi:hypothetical protein
MKVDRICVNRFIDFLEVIGQEVARPISYPEDQKQGDIDALVKPFAIEHMSFDAYEEARSLKVPFETVIGDLEKNFRGKLGFDLKIIFGVYDLKVGQGQDWKTIHSELRKWILNEAPTLTNGSHKITAPDIPFDFTAIKSSGSGDGAIFSRFNPEDSKLSNRLLNGLEINHEKIKKLGPYKV